MAMDRIQSAIAKARAARGDRGVPVAGPRTAPAHAAAWAALPAFAPDPATLARNRVVAAEGSTPAMPFDILRTRMLREMAQQGWKRVAITSPDAGCGKSTLSANLALSLSRHAETRTILGELDLRRPSLAKMLGVTAPVRFGEGLGGVVGLEDQLLRIGDNLAIGVNCAPVAQSSELLRSGATARGVDKLARTYDPDIILFDLPPALRTDDALAFLDHVDCVLIVAEAEVTTRQAIDLCEREVARHKTVLGVVLNKARHVEQAYGYGY